MNMGNLESHSLVIEDETQFMSVKLAEIKNNISAEDAELADNLFKKVVSELGHKQNISEISNRIMNFASDEVTAFEENHKDIDSSIQDILKMGDDEFNVGKSILTIKKEAEELLAASQNMQKNSLMSRISNFLMGTSLSQKLQEQFLSANEVFEGVKKSLKESVVRMEAKNYEVQNRRDALNTSIGNMKKKIASFTLFRDMIDRKIQDTPDRDLAKNIQDSVLFYIDVRLQNLMQTLFVMSQTLAGYTMIIHNNSLLIMATKNSISTSLSALKTNVYVASAAKQGKEQLELVNKIDDLATQAILKTSEQLNQTATDATKKISAGSLEAEKLESAMHTMINALTQIESYKSEALPKIRSGIEKIRVLNNELESKLSSIQSS
ncbi:toxic anion resistance protein [Campylobacter sp. MOP51]|uniref:toxic anion resistance protein n=1 Tax=Campylobacter canis TaxID=3378588 RepID=UPI003C53C726